MKDLGELVPKEQQGQADHQEMAKEHLEKMKDMPKYKKYL